MPCTPRRGTTRLASPDRILLSLSLRGGGQTRVTPARRARARRRLGQCRARERLPLSLMRIHQGTASSSSLRASVQSAVFDVRGNTSTWVARRSSRHNRAAAPAGSCWPAAAPLLSSLSGECRPSSLCAGGGMQVVYHWPHRAQALRHHTLPVRRRLVLILQLSGPTFAQRGKLQASALRGTSRKCVREAAASALLHLISHRPRPGHLRPRHHGVHDCRRHHHHHLGLRRCHQHLCKIPSGYRIPWSI